jgi:hypothetical protein
LRSWAHVVRFLVRAAATERLAVIATYRTDAVQRLVEAVAAPGVTHLHYAVER